jgi:hypothetical protein
MLKRNKAKHCICTFIIVAEEVNLRVIKTSFYSNLSKKHSDILWRAQDDLVLF